MTETSEPPADKAKGLPSFNRVAVSLTALAGVLATVAAIVASVDKIRESAVYKDITALFGGRPQTVQDCLDDGPKSMLEISRCFSEHP